MLGIVIDENQPDYERGDFLVRPILGADPEAGDARDRRAGPGRADRPHARARRRLRRRGPARGAARAGAGARRRGRGGGAAVHLQRPRLAHVRRPRPRRHRRSRTRSARRPAGFFCAGEIGPVGGRNFLHGFTATIARLPARADGASRGAELASSSRGRSPRTSAPATSPPRPSSPADAARPRADRAEAARGRLRPRRRRGGVPRRRGAALRAGSQPRASGATTSRPTWRSSTGPARALLAGERTALNLLGHLSGIATLTARFVEAVARHRRARSSTRARRPRACGRWRRRRSPPAAGATTASGLDDAILIKENHVAIAGGVRRGGRAAPARRSPELEIEVECRDAGRGRRGARGAGADRLLLDNMDARTSCAPPSRARDARGRRARDARGIRRDHARQRRRGRRHRRRLHLGRRADPLGAGARPQHAARAGCVDGELTRRSDDE